MTLAVSARRAPLAARRKAGGAVGAAPADEHRPRGAARGERSEKRGRGPLMTFIDLQAALLEDERIR